MQIEANLSANVSTQNKARFLVLYLLIRNYQKRRKLKLGDAGQVGKIRVKTPLTPLYVQGLSTFVRILPGRSLGYEETPALQVLTSQPLHRGLWSVAVLPGTGVNRLIGYQLKNTS